MKLRLKILLIVLIIPLSVLNGNHASVMADNTISSAYSLTVNTSQTGSLTSNAYYNITVTTPGIYLLNLTGASGTYFNLKLQDNQGLTLYSNYNSNYPENMWVNLTVGTYTVKVYSNIGGGVYTIGFYSKVSYPAGYLISNAINLPLNTTVVDSMPDNRYFNFTVITGFYKINLMANSSTGLSLTLYGSMGNTISYTSGSSYPEVMTQKLNSGTYTIKVSNYIGSGLFNITVNSYTPLPGELLGAAIPLSPNISYQGVMPSNIWFNFTVVTAGDYKIILKSNDTQSFSFDLQDSTGSFLDFSNTVLDHQELPISLINGNYSISVSDYSHYQNDSFQILYEPYTFQAGEVFGNAIPLSLNSNTTGNFPYNFWYNFSITTANTYKVYLSYDNSSAYLYFRLYDSKKLSIDSSIDYGQTSDQLPIYLSAGIYYLKVESSSDINSTYHLEVDPYNPLPGETLNSSIPLSGNSHFSGSVPYNTYFNLTVSTSGRYRIYIESNTILSISFKLYEQNINLNGSSKAYFYFSQLLTNLSSQTFYIIKLSTFISPVDYNISVIPYSVIPGEDANHSIPITINNTYNESLPFNRWFNFNITSSGDYFFMVHTNNNTFLILHLYDNNQNSITSYLVTNLLSAKMNLQPGHYYVSVSSSKEMSNYSISFTTTTSSPPPSPTTTPTPPPSTNTSSSINSNTNSSSSNTNTVTVSTPFMPLTILVLTIISLALIGISRRRI